MTIFKAKLYICVSIIVVLFSVGSFAQSPSSTQVQPSTNEQKRKLAQTLICPVLPCGISIPGDNELDTSSILECAVDEARRKSPDSGRRQ